MPPLKSPIHSQIYRVSPKVLHGTQGAKEVTYGHFRRLPPPIYIGEILILKSREILLNQMREIKSQMREIQMPSGGEEVTYGNFRRLPPPPPLYIGVIH